MDGGEGGRAVSHIPKDSRSREAAVTGETNHAIHNPIKIQIFNAFNLFNFGKSNVFLNNFPAKATYAAIAKTYAYLTPDLWKETLFTKPPYQEFSDYLSKNHRPIGSQKQEVKQY